MICIFYNEMIAKENKVSTNYVKMFAAIMLPILILLPFTSISIIVGGMEVFVLIYVLAFILGVIYAVYQAQVYMVASMTGYAYEGDVLWQVYFTKDSSGIIEENFAATRKSKINAKNTKRVLHFVEEYKVGKVYWNWFFGGPVKITPLKNIELIKKSKKFYKYWYEDKNGRRKKIKIVNAYDFEGVGGVNFG